MVNKEIKRDIIEWDSHNWGKAIDYWAPHMALKKELLCLELGGRRGGLSLLAALHGHSIVCSDLNGPEKRARELNKKYRVEDQITYQSISALDIPYENHFDIILIKSVLPSIGAFGGFKSIKIALDEIYKALKPGGKLLFAENLVGSHLHLVMRRHLTKWGKRVHYLRASEIIECLESFSSLEYKRLGFFATMGRFENQRIFLGKIDGIIDPVLPDSWKYVIIGSAVK